MILLTGGSGYIGSHVCIALLDAGLDVVAVDGFSNSNKTSHGSNPSAGGHSFFGTTTFGMKRSSEATRCADRASRRSHISLPSETIDPFLRRGIFSQS